MASTTNLGSSWSRSNDDAATGLSDVDCLSSTECYASTTQDINGEEGVYYSSGLTSIDVSTLTTTELTMPGIDSQSYSAKDVALGCASTTECFIGDSYGLEGTFNGTTVAPIAVEPPGLDQISCGTTSDCMAVTDAGGLVATNDGGAFWYNLPPIMLHFVSGQTTNCEPVASDTCNAAENVACYSATNCIVSYNSFQTSGTIYGAETTNLGVSWSSLTGETYASSWYSCAQGTTVCVGVGSSNSSYEWYVEISTNGGSTWTDLAGVISDGSAPVAISCGSATMCIAAGDTGDGELITDGSGGWAVNSFSSGISGFGADAITCPTGGFCMVVGNLSATTDAYAATVSGTTVSVQNLTGEANLPSGGANAVACDSSQSCAVFGDTSGGQTTNGGSSFAAITSIGPNNSINGATCPATGTCFAVGDVLSYFGLKKSI